MRPPADVARSFPPLTNAQVAAVAQVLSTVATPAPRVVKK